MSTTYEATATITVVIRFTDDGTGELLGQAFETVEGLINNPDLVAEINIHASSVKPVSEQSHDR